MNVSINGLSGTLSLPDAAKGNSQPNKAVLLISGSGRCDRDGNNEHMITDLIKQFSDIALESGYATFRYDKRGVGRSEGDYYQTGFWQRISDAESIVNSLPDLLNTNISKLIVIGHSEGALVASKLAQQSQFIHGVILLCPPLDPFDYLYKKQGMKRMEQLKLAAPIASRLFRLLGADLLNLQQRILDKINGNCKTHFRFMGRRINAQWIREVMSIDPISFIREVSCPGLIIQGANDTVVEPKPDIWLHERIGEGWNIQTFEGLSHSLQSAEYQIDFRVAKTIREQFRIIETSRIPAGYPKRE